MVSSMLQKRDAHYWDIASKYWSDIATVNPHWAWSTFYCERISDKPLDILVVGVTHGAFLKLLRKFRPQAWVCGIDLSFNMLKEAQKAEKKVVCCRGNALPFRDEEFDIVLSDYFLSVIPENILEETVHEMGRVLKKDGVLIAKELRHRGHIVLWALSLGGTGILFTVSAFVVPWLAVIFGPLWVLTLFAYNPVKHTPGKTAAVFKWVLHVLKFAKRRKRLPTGKEMSDLYYLSQKYLHIFTDGEVDRAFENSPLTMDREVTLLSWSFSLEGVKT